MTSVGGAGVESAQVTATPLTAAGPAPAGSAGYPGPSPSAGYLAESPSAGYPGPSSSDGQPSDGYPPPYYYPEPDRITRFVTRIQSRAPRWAAPVAVLGCVAAAIGYTFLTDPTRSAADAPATCLVKLTTGLDCPGCGGTRAFWYVLNGDLPAAARHHLVFVFALPFLLYLYISWAGRHMFRWRLPELRVTPTTIGVYLAAWMVFSVLRNLPWTPFTWFFV